MGIRFLFCLSVCIPYILEFILVRSDDRYIKLLQMIYIPYHRHKYSPRQCTISHTVPLIFSTTPCHHTIPPTQIFTAPTYHITYRVIYYFHHTVPSYHTTHIPYHIPCHNTHNAMPYRATYHTRQYHTIHTIPNQKHPH